MAWIVGGQVGSALLTVISFRVIGQLAGADGLGRALLYFGVVLLFCGLTAGPISQSIGKFYFDARNDTSKGKLWYSALGMAGVACLLGLAGLFIFFELAGDWGTSRAAFGMLCIALVFEMTRPLCTNWLHSGSEFPAVAVSKWVDGLLRPVTAVIAYKAGFGPVEIVLFAYVCGGGISVAILLVSVLPQLPLSKPDMTIVRKIIVYGRALVANGLFGWFANAGDRYLVAAAIDARAAGIYIAASALGGRVSAMLGAVFETFYRPALYRAATKRDLASLRQICIVWLRHIAVIGGLVFLALLVGIEWIERYLLAPEFRDGAGPIILVSFLAFLAIAIGIIPQRINYAFERTGRVALVEVIGSLTTVTSVFLLGKVYGLNGAVFGLLLSGLFRLGLAAFLAKSTVRGVVAN